MLLRRKHHLNISFTEEHFVSQFSNFAAISQINSISFHQKGPEENVASAKFNSKTILGELRSALLDGDVTNYDMEKGLSIYLNYKRKQSNQISKSLFQVTRDIQ